MTKFLPRTITNQIQQSTLSSKNDSQVFFGNNTWLLGCQLKATKHKINTQQKCGSVDFLRTRINCKMTMKSYIGKLITISTVGGAVGGNVGELLMVWLMMLFDFSSIININ